MTQSSVKYQYFATFCVNIISISYGTVCGWPSASFLILQSDETPLESGPLSNQEVSWVGSILCIGGLVGNNLFGWFSDRLGRKISLLLVAVPQMTCWIILIWAKSVTHLCIARFLGGLAGGGVFVLIPLYITEISEDTTRGALGSFLVFSTNFGMLIAFIVGNYFSYYTVLYILLTLPIVFIVGISSLPETPQHLLKIRKEKEAERALRYFRNIRRISQEPPEIFKTEMQKLRQDYLDYDKISDGNSVSWGDFTNRIAIKACIIGIVLMALNQFCGCFAMLNYTATIFKKAGSTLSPNMSAIIVGIIQLVGSYFSTLLVERAGRKLLITASALGAGCGLLSFGLYTQFEGMGYDLSSFKWIPVASFSFVIFIASWGVLTLPFLVLSEIMPPKIKSIGSIWCMNLLWIFAFLMVKFYPIMSEVIGMSACMYMFAACSFAGGLFVMIVIPETKGKSFETILALLDK